jgi:tetratricopeptide repeat protein 30
MSGVNDLAENLMDLVENAESKRSDGSSKLHSCIINIVIGTLYCAKGNYEFGVSRMLNNMKPVDSKV